MPSRRPALTRRTALVRAAAALATTVVALSGSGAGAADRAFTVTQQRPATWTGSTGDGTNPTYLDLDPVPTSCSPVGPLRQCETSLLAVQLPFPALSRATRVTALFEVTLSKFRIVGQGCPLPEVTGVTRDGNCPVDYDVALYRSNAAGARGELVQKNLTSGGTNERLVADVASTRVRSAQGVVKSTGPTTHYFLLEVYPSVSVASTFEGRAQLIRVSAK